MKIITFWQPWASLIVIGAKPVEWRKESFLNPRSYRNGPKVGERIGIHAGARKVRVSEVEEILERIEANESSLNEKAVPFLMGFLSGGLIEYSAILGTVVMGEPRTVAEIFAEQIRADSTRFDQSKWGWPLNDVQRLFPSIPTGGRQGFWEFPLESYL